MNAFLKFGLKVGVFALLMVFGAFGATGNIVHAQEQTVDVCAAIGDLIRLYSTTTGQTEYLMLVYAEESQISNWVFNGPTSGYSAGTINPNNTGWHGFRIDANHAVIMVHDTNTVSVDTAASDLIAEHFSSGSVYQYNYAPLSWSGAQALGFNCLPEIEPSEVECPAIEQLEGATCLEWSRYIVATVDHGQTIYLGEAQVPFGRYGFFLIQNMGSGNIVSQQNSYTPIDLRFTEADLVFIVTDANHGIRRLTYLYASLSTNTSPTVQPLGVEQVSLETAMCELLVIRNEIVNEPYSTYDWYFVTFESDSVQTRMSDLYPSPIFSRNRAYPLIFDPSQPQYDQGVGFEVGEDEYIILFYYNPNSSDSMLQTFSAAVERMGGDPAEMVVEEATQATLDHHDFDCQ